MFFFTVCLLSFLAPLPMASEFITCMTFPSVHHRRQSSFLLSVLHIYYSSYYYYYYHHYYRHCYCCRYCCKLLLLLPGTCMHKPAPAPGVATKSRPAVLGREKQCRVPDAVLSLEDQCCRSNAHNSREDNGSTDGATGL